MVLKKSAQKRLIGKRFLCTETLLLKVAYFESRCINTRIMNWDIKQWAPWQIGLDKSDETEVFILGLDAFDGVGNYLSTLSFTFDNHFDLLSPIYAAPLPLNRLLDKRLLYTKLSDASLTSSVQKFLRKQLKQLR